MNSNMAYSNLIQENIRRYGWQSFGTKMITAVLAVAILVLSQILTPFILSFASIFCMILWLLDGHYSALKEEYVLMFQEVTTSNEAPVKVRVAKANRLNVAALWSPTALVFYPPIIGMLAIMVLR